MRQALPITSSSAPSSNLGFYPYFSSARHCRLFKKTEEQGEHTHSEAHKEYELGNDCRPVKYSGETKHRSDERDDYAVGSTS
jgi:hypothetical protein